jgi:hypothetical protein
MMLQRPATRRTRRLPKLEVLPIGWSEEEDMKLRRKDLWRDIYKQLPGRTPNSCRGRHRRLLKEGPLAKASLRWSKKEAKKLNNLVNKSMGWEEISKQLPGRSILGCQKYIRKVRDRTAVRPSPQRSPAEAIHQQKNISTSKSSQSYKYYGSAGPRHSPLQSPYTSSGSGVSGGGSVQLPSFKSLIMGVGFITCWS